MTHLYPVKRSATVRSLLFLAAVALALGLLLYAVASVSRRTEQEQQQMVERSIRQALVSCYAIEGLYPSELSYLEEHYGLWIDHERFVVDYEAIGSNIWPSILVVRRGNDSLGGSI